ncbi:MAG: electron transport complex subunit RsxC [Candidatus Sericytochromatia bacterium]|nr:electron transport complex subunit RsxC [Candidatus Tanganyikabacteria bacterium]
MIQFGSVWVTPGSSPGFRHGVHPPENKELTEHLPIRRLPYPAEVVIPLRQHTGKPARAVVRAGQHVERGDVIAEADGFVSVPMHASAAGRVVEVGLWPHPDGSWSPAVRIAVDPFSAQIERPRLVPAWEPLTPKEVGAAIQQAGLVGLGGAAFPTHVKLAPPPDVTLDTLVVNGCECEPYLTTDHRTMVEYAERVHMGVRILLKALGVSRALIGVERNKPDAIAALQRTRPADLPVEVVPLEVKYPQGAEKMLIKTLLGREVPSGKLPMHVGVVVQNVGSVATVAEVFETRLPLVERIVTVTGRGVRQPANLIVPIGTKLRDLLEACGGLAPDAGEVIFGGPMMGVAQASLDVPVLKGTTGVVVLSRDDVKVQEQHPCIRCGRCIEACPMLLNPQMLGRLAKAGKYEDMPAYHLADCVLCGCCSYACPSNIPLPQLFVAARGALRKQQASA